LYRFYGEYGPFSVNDYDLYELELFLKEAMSNNYRPEILHELEKQGIDTKGKFISKLLKKGFNLQTYGITENEVIFLYIAALPYAKSG